MNKPKIGIIIVTFNSEQYIVNCLNSLLKNKYLNSKILVIDNNSGDHTVDLVLRKYKQIKVIKNTNNIGFGAANNIGIIFFKNKGYDFVLLINPDTISSPQLLHKLVNVFEINRNIGAAGCVITYGNNSEKIWFGGGYFNKTFCYTRHKYMNQNLRNSTIKSGNVDFITGACLMFNLKIIDAELFPEEYFLYFEDVFFCQKIINLGYGCFFLAEPLVKHFVSTSTGIESTNKMTPLRAFYFARNPLLYIRNNVKGYLKFTNLIGQLFIRLPFYLFIIIKDKNLKSFKAYCRGLLSGFFIDKINSSLKIFL